FKMFVPPNADNSGRRSCLVLTAIKNNTTVTVVDDNMDGDSDDSWTGVLNAGQSYVIYIVNGAVNDDIGGKHDGDYFIVTSDSTIVAYQATNSQWQHDFVPSTNKTNLGTEFYIYSYTTGGSNNDLDIFAYQNGTTVQVYDLGPSGLTSTQTGITTVSTTPTLILTQTLNIGEDLIYFYTSGRDIFQHRRTYKVVTNKPVTCMTGQLWTGGGGIKDAGAYVPSNTGFMIGNLFYFIIPTDACCPNEMELRLASYSPVPVNVTLSCREFDGSTWSGWNNITSWTLSPGQTADWVNRATFNGVSYNNKPNARIFRITADTCAQVTVLEANWMETGSIGTSDMLNSVASANGSGVGNIFRSYIPPPGNKASSVNPFTSLPYGGTFSHVYAYSNVNNNTITLKDKSTGGTILNLTQVVHQDKYVDFLINTTTWNSMNVPSAGKRPWVEVSGTGPMSVMSGNWNDNWHTYANTSKPFVLQSTAILDKNSVSTGDTLTILYKVYNPSNTTLTVNTIQSYYNPLEYQFISASLTHLGSTHSPYIVPNDTVKFTGFPTSIAVDDTFYFQLKLKVNKSASNPNDHNTIIIPSQLYASASAPGSCKIVTDNNTNITFLPVPKITLYTDKQKTLWWKVHTDTYARVILEYLDEVSKQFKHSQFDYPYTQDPRQQVVSNHKYWRAKLVTKDGLWTYSNVVELTNMDAPAMPVFEVYPNPATNVLNVDLLYGKVKYTRLEVYDVFGRLIFWHVTHITDAGEKAQIDISGLNAGMYLVKIST
ncbi:MAG: T9SS type A sorting domain-containing protein, partial [Bacteroidia bacterium]|nr:T9SS type A sorting domain-containing protein [Bacteroidia bacterium]